MFSKMKKFILMLLFSKTILLTTSPVDLTDTWMQIVPKSPLKAITSGASLQIDISSIVGNQSDFKILQQMFPKGTVEANLICSSGEKVILQDGSFAYSNNEIRMILDGVKPIPTDETFVRVQIKSKRVMPGVKIYWKNFKN